MPGTSPVVNNTVVRAGAGAGKTTRLTKEVLGYARAYFAANGKYPRLVVTTFTRKATEELRERLIQIAVKEQDPGLLKFLTSRSQLHISTIHGVLSLFLRRYGHLLEIDAGFTVIDQQEMLKTATKIVREIAARRTDLFGLLEEYSVQRLAGMLLDFYESKKVVEDIRFISSAEFRDFLANERVRSADAIENICARLSTADSKLEAYLTAARHLAAAMRNPKITLKQLAAAIESTSDMKPARYSAKWGVTKEDYDGLKTELDKNLAPFLEGVYSDEVLEKWGELTEKYSEFGEEFVTALTVEMESSGKLTMADLELQTLQVTRAHPEIASAFAADWDYWLIDEFQDTSPIQVELMGALIGNSPAFVVGDPQQSIYLFRGARVEVFEKREAQVLANKGNIETLSTNYRSIPELLEFFNFFFGRVDSKFLHMHPKSPVQDPAKTVARVNVVPEDASEPYSNISAIVVDEIQKSSNSDDKTHLGDFCILARTNDELLAIARYLESKGIATHLHSSSGYFSRREVLDALSILKFLFNPHDNVNFIRMARSPWLRVADADLADLVATRPISYWRGFRQRFTEHPIATKLTSLLGRVEKLGATETLRTALMEMGVFDVSSYHDATGRRESNLWKLISLLHDAERAPGFGVMRFVERALDDWSSAEGFEESDAVAASEPNRVNLMTVHKSKGLKFKHVFLINMHKRPTSAFSKKHEQPFVFNEDEGWCSIALRTGEAMKTTHHPLAVNYFRALEGRERDENKRLLYVALTRASHSVFLHWVGKPDANSWAGAVGIELDQGKHSHANFSYEVLPHIESGPVLVEAGDTKTALRPQYALKPVDNGIKQSRFSVSSVLDADEVAPQKNGGRPKDLATHVLRPVIGSKIHEAFERFRFDPDFDLDKFLKTWFGPEDRGVQAGIHWALGLDEPPMPELIKSGDAEWGFQLSTPKGIMEGQIDLWGVVDGVVWIVDYKSGDPTKVTRALNQLDLYSLAIRKLHPNAKIKAAVIFPLDKKVVTKDVVDETQIREQFGL